MIKFVSHATHAEPHYRKGLNPHAPKLNDTLLGNGIVYRLDLRPSILK